MVSKLESILQEFGVSQRALAEALGLPRGRVALLTSGQETPTRLEDFAFDGFAAALRSGDQNIRFMGRPLSGGPPIGALAASLEGDQWSFVTARLGLPWLARTLKPVSYGGFHDAVVARGGKRSIGTLTKYGWPLARIGDAMQEVSRRLDKTVPPLEALVYNAKSCGPSSGVNPYLRDYFNETSRRELARRIVPDQDAPRDIVELVQNEIAEFTDWDEVVRMVGLTGDPKEDA